MMRLAVVVLVAAASVCRAQQDPGAVKVLEEAAEAARGLLSLSYTMEFKGDLAGLSQTASTKVDMVRDLDRESSWAARWLGSHKINAEGLEPTRIELSTDGEHYVYLDHDRSMWFKQPKAAVRGKPVEPLVYAWFAELAEDNPYSQYLKAPGLSLEAPAQAGGVMCDVILADMGSSQAKRRWWIGQVDRMPRRLQWEFAGGVTGTWTWDVRNLDINPAMSARDLELPAPEGYHKIEPPTRQPGPPQGGMTITGDSSGLTTRARTTGVEEGNIAPEFELPLVTFGGQGPGAMPVKGQTLKLSSLRGSVVVLDFWGSWCAPCRTAHPEMQRMVNALQGRPVRLLGLAVREKDEAKPIEYMTQNGYAWDLLQKADDVARQYKVRAFPSFFVIGFEGEIIHVASGFEAGQTIPQMQSVIQNYLSSAPKPTADPAEGGAGDRSGDATGGK